MPAVKAIEPEKRELLEAAGCIWVARMGWFHRWREKAIYFESVRDHGLEWLRDLDRETEA
jgi:hypothetical protein